MSKRKSQTAVSDYIAEGFIREALVNYLALLGWATGTEEEVLSIDEIVERFELDRRPQGRRRLRPRAARVAQRPVDPAARAGRPRRAAPAVRRAADLAAGRIDRMPVGRRAARAAADHLGAPADARRDRRPGRLPVGRRPAARRRPCSSRSAGTRRRRSRGSTRPRASRSPRPAARHLRGRRARAAAPRAGRGARLEGRRPVHGHPRRGHRPDRDAAAVRHARRARAWSGRWSDSIGRSSDSLTDADPGRDLMTTRGCPDLARPLHRGLVEL